MQKLKLLAVAMQCMAPGMIHASISEHACSSLIYKLNFRYTYKVLTLGTSKWQMLFLAWEVMHKLSI